MCFVPQHCFTGSFSLAFYVSVPGRRTLAAVAAWNPVKLHGLHARGWSGGGDIFDAVAAWTPLAVIFAFTAWTAPVT